MGMEDAHMYNNIKMDLKKKGVWVWMDSLVEYMIQQLALPNM